MNGAYLTVSQFGRMTGIRRENLIFYDRIGLLKPEVRGDNGYRYYTRRQLATGFLVISLRGIGFGIEAIHQYASQRTPEKMIDLFEHQKLKIQEEIEKLQRLKGVMGLYQEMAANTLACDKNDIVIRHQKKQPLFLGKPLPPGYNEEDEMAAFFEYAQEKGMELFYPYGVLIDQKALDNPATATVKSFYFRTIRSQGVYKPEGRYVVGYRKGDYHSDAAPYQHVYDFIKRNGLVVCSDGYEECTLNEMSTISTQEYLYRLEIMIES